MNKIHLLESKIANMIAAGEVVERPSGVVKELVENAIDAKSSRIEVHLKQGGIKEISVIDNGCGMNKDDAKMAFQRHATSKILLEDDLWKIQTLGFRGEALPSIASVSDVTMRTSDGNDGCEINIVNGDVKAINNYPMRKGTQIIVRDLFFTLPARFKHLKAVPYEFNLILDILQKLALSNPTIAFVLSHDNKEVFRTNGNGDLLNIIFAIYGADVAKSCVKLAASNDDFEIEGYMCLPHITRSSRNHMVVFLNSRLIKAYRIQQAIIDGYAKYIAEKRIPIIFINIKMDFSLVDVNVHPSKWEVRLSKEYQLYELIAKAVEDSLSNSIHKQGSIIGSIGLNKKISSMEEQLAFSEKIIRQDQNASLKSAFFVDETIDKIKNPKELIEVKTKISQNVIVNDVNKDNKDKFKSMVSLVQEAVVETQTKQDIIETQVLIDEVKKIPFLQVIGQLHGSYIIATSVEGLVVIDQHAANERINFELIMAKLKTEKFEQKGMLIPLVITLKTNHILMIDQMTPILAKIGIVFESFGDNDIIIRELPTWINVNNEEVFLLDLIDHLSDEKNLDLAKMQKKTLATIACHASVRFNHNLSMEEMNETIGRLFQCENPYHCPHGRPTMITYAIDDLRKLFERT